MATVTVSTPTPTDVSFGVPYRLSSSDYFRMVEAGIIPPERRVGLWEGQLYEKMAKKIAHAGVQNLLITAFVRMLPAGWSVWVESPILVDDFSAPLPDLAVVRGDARDYMHRGTVPRAEEIGLVVEVSDSTLKKDLGETLRTYARAGLATYWVVNLVSRRVEVYSRPVTEGDSAGYQSCESFEPGVDVPVSLGGVEAARVAVRDLLPEESR
ncbi:MAG: Uma2 family endonuclease [Isosphaeraceae bacterium]